MCVSCERRRRKERRKKDESEKQAEDGELGRWDGSLWVTHPFQYRPGNAFSFSCHTLAPSCGCAHGPNWPYNLHHKSDICHTHAHTHHTSHTDMIEPTDVKDHLGLSRYKEKEEFM